MQMQGCAGVCRGVQGCAGRRIALACAPALPYALAVPPRLIRTACTALAVPPVPLPGFVPCRKRHGCSNHVLHIARYKLQETLTLTLCHLGHSRCAHTDRCVLVPTRAAALSYESRSLLHRREREEGGGSPPLPVSPLSAPPLLAPAGPLGAEAARHSGRRRQALVDRACGRASCRSSSRVCRRR